MIRYFMVNLVFTILTYWNHTQQILLSPWIILKDAFL